MTIPVLPGWWDQLQPGFESLSKGLVSVFNPYGEQDKALQQALVTNPELAEKLRKTLARDPNYLTRLGFKKSNQKLLQTPLSDQAKTELEIEGLSADIFQTLTPEQKKDLARRKVGAKSTEELADEEVGRKTKAVQFDLAELQKQADKILLDVLPTLKKGDVAKAESLIAEHQANQAVQGLLKKYGADLFMADYEKKMAPEDKATLFASEYGRKMYDTSMENYWRRQSLELSRETSRANRKDLAASALWQYSNMLSSFAGVPPTIIHQFSSLPVDDQVAYMEGRGDTSTELGQAFVKVAEATKRVSEGKLDTISLPAVREYRLQTADAEKTLRNKAAGKKQIEEAIRQLNEAANFMVSNGLMSPEKAPRYAMSGGWWKGYKPVLVSGDVAFAKSTGIDFVTSGQDKKAGDDQALLADKAKLQALAQSFVNSSKAHKATAEEQNNALNEFLKQFSPEVQAELRKEIMRLR